MENVVSYYDMMLVAGEFAWLKFKPGGIERDTYFFFQMIKQ